MIISIARAAITESKPSAHTKRADPRILGSYVYPGERRIDGAGLGICEAVLVEVVTIEVASMHDLQRGAQERLWVVITRELLLRVVRSVGRAAWTARVDSGCVHAASPRRFDDAAWTAERGDG